MYDNVKFLRGGIHTAGEGYVHVTRDFVRSSELIIVTEGTLYMMVDTEKYELCRGDILYIPPYTRHGGYRESLGVSFIWLHFSGADEELFTKGRLPISSDRATLLAREILHYAHSEEYPEECSDYLMRVLISELSCQRVPFCPAVRAARSLISERGGAVGAGECAELLGYNVDYLCRLFKKECGIGLKQYIDRIRLDAIKRELLTGKDSLSGIAESFGFNEYKSFLKFFKYHEGLTPTEYVNSYYIK